MEYIFHEKQEGSLCAQHCLNALLQGEYFTAVDLADIAGQLDEEERRRMAEGDPNSPEYLRFLEQPSGNMDDSGFFSVQVISDALRVWGLQLEPLQSENALGALANPLSEKAFICNYREHWLTIRKLGNQWFNLNSLLAGPELISDTYLSLFLAQLQQEGYSIFVVEGELPNCEGDQLLKLMRVEQMERPSYLSNTSSMSVLPSSLSSTSNAEESSSSQSEVVEKALEASRQSEEERQLLQAVEMSLKGSSSSKTDTGGPSELSANNPDAEEIRKKRQEYFDRAASEQSSTKFCSSDKESPTSSSADNVAATSEEKNFSEMTEEEMLEAAMEMSLEGQ